MYILVQVVIEGVVGKGPRGDIAIDDIYITREGPTSAIDREPLPASGLPILCEFGVSSQILSETEFDREFI